MVFKFRNYSTENVKKLSTFDEDSRYTQENCIADTRRLVRSMVGGAVSGSLSGGAMWALNTIYKNKSNNENLTLSKGVRNNAKGFTRTAFYVDGADIMVTRAREKICADKRPRPSDTVIAGFLSGNERIQMFEGVCIARTNSELGS